MMKILCVGEMMADLVVYPVSGAIDFSNTAVQVGHFDIKSGGDANNNAIDLARLGNEVYYAGLTGNDQMGEYVRNVAGNSGVNMDFVRRSEHTGQAKSLILINEQGDRSFVQYSGTSGEFSLGDIDLSLLDRVDFLQISGTFHLPHFDGGGAEKLLKLAREKGIVTSMDCTTDHSGRWNSVIECCYPYLDYFLPSIEQAAPISGRKEPQKIAAFFLERGVGTAVIKLGTAGSYCQTGSDGFYCGSYHVPVAETTGAGDAFVAGFLTAVGMDCSPEDAVIFATATASFAVRSYGATDGIPDRDAVCRFIRENPRPAVTRERTI